LIQPWTWNEWDLLPERFVNEVIYITNLINEIEARRSGGYSGIDADDAGTDMEGELAGISEAVVNG
tara:strand:+ start:587 stop:784 length:198 start_codon:yes stop_codon:yes gene_type:complete